MKKSEVETMEEARQWCDHIDRVLDWKWRNTRQGMFEYRMLPLEFAIDDGDSDSPHLPNDWQSDGGRGVEAIISFDDDKPVIVGRSERSRRYHAAYVYLGRTLPQCIPVFVCIVRNGKNRKESINELCEMMMVKKMRAGERPNVSTTSTAS